MSNKKRNPETNSTEEIEVYLCDTDFAHEVGEAKGAHEIYNSLEEIIKERVCVRRYCDVVKAKLVKLEYIKTPDESKREDFDSDSEPYHLQINETIQFKNKAEAEGHLKSLVVSENLSHKIYEDLKREGWSGEKKTVCDRPAYVKYSLREVPSAETHLK